jgi:hypothetical protein
MAKKETESVKNPFEGFNILKTQALDIKDTQVEEIPHVENEETIDSTEEIPEIKNEEVSEEEDNKEEIPHVENESVEKPVNSSKTEETEEESTEFSYKPFIEHLTNKGILSLDENGEIEDSDEGFDKAIEYTAIKKAEDAISKYKESLPEDLHKLVEFVELGGNPKEFLDVYYGNSSFENVDITKEENQKHVVREGLRLSGWDESEIEEELKDYEDLGKLETKAKSLLVKLQNHETVQKANLIKAQEEYANTQKENVKKYWEDLKTDLYNKENINGFQLNKKIKDEVWEFMSSPDRKTGKTKLQVHNETNKDAQFLYAYLAYNNWDISKLEKEVKTKVTSELRKNLSKFTDTRTKIKSGRSEVQKEEENPFAGFKTIK